MAMMKEDDGTRLHGVVRALDLGQVDEAGGVAEKKAAREREARHGLDAALNQRTRAVRDALAALERVPHERMVLPPLMRPNVVIITNQ
jgi:hypothetical protein